MHRMQLMPPPPVARAARMAGRGSTHHVRHGGQVQVRATASAPASAVAPHVSAHSLGGVRLNDALGHSSPASSNGILPSRTMMALRPSGMSAPL